MLYIPNIFVARKGQQVYGGEVGVYSHKVERQQDCQDLHDQPHQRWAGLNSQQLRRKPEGAQNDVNVSIDLYYTINLLQQYIIICHWAAVMLLFFKDFL